MSLAIAVAKPQGDPGLFGFLGGAIKTVAKIGTSFIPGPAGAIARGLTGRLFGGGAAAPRPDVRALPMQRETLPVLFGPNGRVDRPPQRFQQPQQERITMPTGQVGVDATPAIGCPKGYKPNKSGYYRTIKSPGNPEGGVFYIQPGSRCVKIRRRNPANPRAADRALGRIKSAKRFATKMGAVTIRSTCGCKSRRKK